MKWDEIHDQSRVVVDKAIENLLAEGKGGREEGENDIVEKLRDVEYVGKKLEKRNVIQERCFLRPKHQMERRKRLARWQWMASAACVAVVCVILLQ